MLSEAICVALPGRYALLHCAVNNQGAFMCVMLVLQAAGLDVELPDDSRQLRNQFNFSERAAQTFSYPMRDRATFTEPAPTATISGQNKGLHEGFMVGLQPAVLGVTASEAQHCYQQSTMIAVDLGRDS